MSQDLLQKKTCEGCTNLKRADGLVFVSHGILAMVVLIGLIAATPLREGLSIQFLSKETIIFFLVFLLVTHAALALICLRLLFKFKTVTEYPRVKKRQQHNLADEFAKLEQQLNDLGRNIIVAKKRLFYDPVSRMKDGINGDSSTIVHLQDFHLSHLKKPQKSALRRKFSPFHPSRS